MNNSDQLRQGTGQSQDKADKLACGTDESIINWFSSYDPNYEYEQTGEPPTSDEIKQIQGYDDDPSCLYVLAYNALKQTPPDIMAYDQYIAEMDKLAESGLWPNPRLLYSDSYKNMKQLVLGDDRTIYSTGQETRAED
jgi:hypothetical protein